MEYFTNKKRKKKEAQIDMCSTQKHILPGTRRHIDNIAEKYNNITTEIFIVFEIG